MQCYTNLNMWKKLKDFTISTGAATVGTETFDPSMFWEDDSLQVEFLFIEISEK